MLRRSPRSTRTATLFPDTTLCRADLEGRPLDAWMVLGQVVGVHIARAFPRDGLFDTAAARPILRGVYLADYFEATPATTFQMRGPACYLCSEGSRVGTEGVRTCSSRRLPVHQQTNT